jgi:hypothetical protein
MLRQAAATIATPMSMAVRLSARADRGIRQNGVHDLGGIAPTGGVIQLSDAVEKAPPLLPPPALHQRFTGHDHSLPSTAAPASRRQHQTATAASAAIEQFTLLPLRERPERRLRAPFLCCRPVAENRHD